MNPETSRIKRAMWYVGNALMSVNPIYLALVAIVLLVAGTILVVVWS